MDNDERAKDKDKKLVPTEKMDDDKKAEDNKDKKPVHVLQANKTMEKTTEKTDDNKRAKE